MGTDSMQVDSKGITMDTMENPFAAFGQSIVGNITAYSSFDDEEEVKKKEVEEIRKERIQRVKAEKKIKEEEVKKKEKESGRETEKERRRR